MRRVGDWRGYSGRATVGLMLPPFCAIAAPVSGSNPVVDGDYGSGKSTRFRRKPE